MNDVDEINSEVFGKLIGKWRNEQNISKEQFAKLVGLDVTEVIKMERGELLPTTDTLYHFYIYANMNIDNLFNEHREEVKKLR